MKWPTELLGSLCDVISGGTPKRTVDEYWNGEIPWVKISDMLQGEIKYTDESITAKGLRESPARLLEPGTLLLSIFATVGRTAVLAIPAATNQAIVGLRIKTENLDQRYLRHYLDSQAEALKSKSRGVAQDNINTSILKSLEIPLPPLEEQRRIAAILDKATELELLSMKQSSLLEDAEKHLFLEYFGSPFPATTPWPVALLGELGSLERGISKHRPRNDPSLMDGPYPFIQTGDVAGCRSRITTFSSTYSEKGLAQSRLWPAGTLCITIAANIAKTGILDFDACFPDSVVGFQDGNPAIITYVQCWMSFLQGHIEQMAPESAQKNINLEILRRLPVPVPSEDRLEKFHAAILALRRTWSRSTHRLGRAAELKSSLQSVSFAA